MSKYEILPYTFKKLKELNKKLNENITIKPSTRGNYKIDIFNSGTYLFSIGDRRYLSYPEYLKTGKLNADKRRELYYKRHKPAPKYSKQWFGAYLLW